MIKAEVVYSFKDFVELNNVANPDKKVFKNILTVFGLIWILTVLLVSIFCSILTIKIFVITCVTLFFLFGLCVYIWVFGLLPIFNSKKKFQMKNEFEFLDNKFNIKATTKLGIKKNTYNYSDLSKVLETVQRLYIYITDTKLYIVPKNTITEGTPEQLSEILHSALGKNYKVKNNID